MSTKQDDSTALDPSQRRLCPDGACVGLIGHDGKCKICGSLDPDRTGATPAEGTPALPTPEPEIDQTGPAPATGAEETFAPKRRLCPDDACIGVIGSDNKCSICGRRG